MKQVKPTDIYPQATQHLAGNLEPAKYLQQAVFTSLYRFSYFGDWLRVDDPIAMTAAIDRPDLHQVIFLNLSRRTYHVLTATPPPQSSSAGSASVQPSQASTPGQDNYELQASSESILPMVIDGISTVGARVSFLLRPLHSTASCAAFTLTTIITRYYATNYETPTRVEWAVPPLPKETCLVVMERGLVDPPDTSKLPIYVSVETRTSSLENAARVMGYKVLPIVSVTEYGNVARLGTQDRLLFDIPGGFTLEK